MSSSRFPFPTLPRRQPCLPRPSKRPRPNLGPGSAWEDLRAKLPAAVLHAGGMETKSSRTNP